ncbi:enoyl-CoA hydratase/isomerase family protein [Leucobacter sp. HY1910]
MNSHKEEGIKMHLEVETHGSLGVIWLNRPEKLNPLTDEMMLGMREAIGKFEQDPAVHAIVIRGRGRAFSAGFDISADSKPRSTVLEWRAHFRNGNDTFRAIRNSQKPVIAVTHGPCMGGAFEMALSCDIVIATPESFFGETEVRFGGTAMFMILPFVASPRLSQRLLLTGDRLSAEEALAEGVITHLVAESDINEKLQEYARKFAALPPGTAAMNKLALRRVFDLWGAAEATEMSEDLAIHAIMSKEGTAVEFERITQEQGLAAAIRWRDAQFDAA